MAGHVPDVGFTARKLAAGLRQRGFEPGDAVAFQLPNWMEAAAVYWASALPGTVTVPIMHFYGRKEVGYILTAVKCGRIWPSPAWPGRSGRKRFTR